MKIVSGTKKPDFSILQKNFSFKNVFYSISTDKTSAVSRNFHGNSLDLGV